MANEIGGEIIPTLLGLNTLATARWTIIDSNGREWGPTGGHKVASKTEGLCSQTKVGVLDGCVDYIEVKVQWSNVNISIPRSSITIDKPIIGEIILHETIVYLS